MAQPKRKQPEKATSRKKQRPALATRMLHASGAALSRHPRTIGGLVAFGVVFSFVAANALWYQPRHHPAPLLATRMFEPVAKPSRQVEKAEAVDEDPNVTTFRIERQQVPETKPETAKKSAEKPVVSPLIRNIQTALASRGLYNGPSDGLSGPKTTSAILFYEETEGLAPTGLPSAALLARLKKVKHEIAVIPDERPSMDTTASTRKTDDIAALINADQKTASAKPDTQAVSPALVMKIQKGLSGMAYADVKVDGLVGEATRTAIRAFEKSYRLPVTGEPSERLLKKLKSIGAIR